MVYINIPINSTEKIYHYEQYMPSHAVRMVYEVD